MTLVLDASMTIAWLFDDVQTEAARKVARSRVAQRAIGVGRCAGARRVTGDRERQGLGIGRRPH